MHHDSNLIIRGVFLIGGGGGGGTKNGGGPGFTWGQHFTRGGRSTALAMHLTIISEMSS